MDKFRRLLLILAFLVVAIISFRSFLLAHFIQPIALLFWGAWRVVSSVNQHIYWSLLVAFCVMAFMRLLLSGSDMTPGSTYQFESLPPDRVAYWQLLISKAAMRSVERARLLDDLKELLLKVNGDRDRSDSILIDEMAASRWQSLPVELKQSLLPSEGKVGTNRRRRKVAITPRLPLWIRRSVSSLSRTDTSWIDETLKWMEVELDINNGE